MNKRDQDQIWFLISRKLTGEATETELQKLQEFISENPGMQLFMELITATWKPGVEISIPEMEQAYARHMNRMKVMAHKNQVHKKSVWENKSKFRESVYRCFNMGIFNNYFKVIYRNLYRFKSFSLINITGLAIGMASAILILLLVQNELSYDQFHEKKDRIYMLFNRGIVEWPDGNVWYAECTRTGIKSQLSAGGRNDPPEWNGPDRSFYE